MQKVDKVDKIENGDPKSLITNKNQHSDENKNLQLNKDEDSE